MLYLSIAGKLVDRVSQSTYFPAIDRYNIYTYTRYAAASPTNITK